MLGSVKQLGSSHGLEGGPMVALSTPFSGPLRIVSKDVSCAPELP